jgi:hypothetical protein
MAIKLAVTLIKKIPPAGGIFTRVFTLNHRLARAKQADLQDEAT